MLQNSSMIAASTESLVHDEKTSIPNTLETAELCLSFRSPCLYPREISTCMKGVCVQDYLVSHTVPLHRCEIRVALNSLT